MGTITQQDLTAAQAEKIRQYGAAWDDWQRRVEYGLDQGWDLTQIVDDWNANRAKTAGVIEDEFRSRILELDLAAFAGAPADAGLSVDNGRYVQVSQTPPSPIFPILEQLIDADVDCVVEFGAGLGFNLAQLRVNLGMRPITYITCEPTRSGRDTASLLFAQVPETSFAAYPFDYLTPDLSCLNGFRKIIAFTNHSIEQITVLGDAFHRKLLDFPVAACLHAEPVGWQRFAELRDFMAELLADRERFCDLISRLKIVLKDSQIPQNALQWSARHLYNTDLLTVLDELAKSGLLVLKYAGFDSFAANPLNPSTILVWTKP